MKTVEFSEQNRTLIETAIKSGEVCVLPSDTLYGFSCDAFNQQAVEKIYELKQREGDKPFIVLIPNVDSITDFGVKLDQKQRALLNSMWPAKLTVVIDCKNESFKYLHRGKESIGFRVPSNELLLKLLLKTGPVTSTTVNLSGDKPCENIDEAQKLFGDKVNLYIENGEMSSEPSTVAKLTDDSLTILRQGDAILK